MPPCARWEIVSSPGVAGPADHVHSAVPDNQLKKEVYAKVRHVSTQNIFRSAQTIAEQILRENVGPDNAVIPKKKLLKRVANRTRAKHRPEEPKTLDFEVNLEYLQCDDFLVKDISFEGQRHFVFSTPYQLELLRNARRWYMDGTFKVLGAPFKRQGQLMSIHAVIEKDGEIQQFPLVFCLMSRKTKSDYVQIFDALKEHVGQVQVEGFVLDFETAAWNAVRESFPGAEIKGCAFHWSQAVWRRVVDVGLAETYQRRTGVHSFIRQLLSLQFLPSTHIRQAFDALKGQATTEATRLLVDYIESQWIHNTVFPVESWSVFRQTIRTNNDVEGWHHRLNSKAVNTGLQFYRLVPLLQTEAEDVRLSIRAGDVTRNMRGRSKTLERSLRSLWSDYETSEITTSKFLKRCGELYGVRV